MTEAVSEAVPCVWDAIEDDPAKRAELRERSDLMMAISRLIQEDERPLAVIAQAVDVPPADLQHVLQGRINLLDLASLRAAADRLGVRST